MIIIFNDSETKIRYFKSSSTEIREGHMDATTLSIIVNCIQDYYSSHYIERNINHKWRYIESNSLNMRI